MGTFSLMHWLVVIAVVLIVFGAGRLPNAMGDLAKGFKAFRKGLREDEPPIDGPSPERPASVSGGPARTSTDKED